MLFYSYSTSWKIPKTSQVHSLVLSPLQTLVHLPLYLSMFVQLPEVEFLRYIFSNNDLRKIILTPTFLMDMFMDEVQSLHCRYEVLCLFLFSI